MTNKVTKKINWNGKTLEISTGKIAIEANGAVLVKMGDSVVLCTCVVGKEPKVEQDFLALSVNYREMAFSAGKIPGGFLKKEGKNTDKEILSSRLIDRPIRPLFPKHFMNETQVICTVLSYDNENSTDILAIIGASAAISIAGLPFKETIAAARIGLINDAFIINPSYEELKNSKLDLVIAGSDESVMMVEADADLLTEEQILDAIKFGHLSLKPVIELIKELTEEVGKQKINSTEIVLDELKEVIKKQYENVLTKIIQTANKKERNLLVDQLILQATQDLADTEYTQIQIKNCIIDSKAKMMRFNILENAKRVDGRNFTQIRPIDCEISLLPRAHGSALFTRGETQALVVATLGTAQDEQIIDSLDGEYKERFMLNYIFPPYSVGEVSSLRAPGRREIGHGRLAWKAFNRVIPSKIDFPYSIRVVSEITSCNGSSSMATICGTSMALMDAGVDIKTPIAGIAMGLIKENDKYSILSDIVAFEDALGDMDFKIAGSKEAITALQMDIKIPGITFDIMKDVLNQAKDGRQFILSEMEKTISKNKSEVSQHAPFMQTIKINKDKIREVIGTGGKVIREISESTSCKIDINDDGNISLAGATKEKVEAAIARINSITLEAKIGDTFDGTVVKVLESLSFVSYGGSKEGVLHISEVAEGRNITSLTTLLKQGDIIKVKVIGFDMKGKAKLTTKLDKPNISEDKNRKPESKEKNANSKTPSISGTVKSSSVPSSTDNINNVRPINNTTEGNAKSSARNWKSSGNATKTEPVKSERKYFS